MKDFRQHFLLDSIEKLQNLIADLENRKNLTEADRNALFRVFHTIKGTAQTFGLNAVSRLAHELEDLLAARTRDKNFKRILLEGIRLLKEACERKDFIIPEEFSEKLRKLAPAENKTPNLDLILSKLPERMSGCLSAPERSALAAELGKGKNPFGAEIGFDPADFSAGLKEFREVLNSSGVIIATFPSPGFTAQGKIGFQILFASLETVAKIKEIIEKSAAELIFDGSPEVFAFDLQGILANVAAHGRTVAESLGKTIGFEVSAGDFQVSEKNLRLIFDSLVHLTHNAVDHAFTTVGQIKIALESNENGLNIKFSDNGRGIDPEEIRKKAFEKNPFQANLSDEAALQMIFQPEFSTAPEITEISGRGVGLDTVKTAVEDAGGTVKVESKLNEGTVFEIFLPE